MYGVRLSCVRWECSTHTTLVNRVVSKAIRLINSHLLTVFNPTFCSNIVSLIIFYNYFYGYCFWKLARCMPTSLVNKFQILLSDLQQLIQLSTCTFNINFLSRASAYSHKTFHSVGLFLSIIIYIFCPNGPVRQLAYLKQRCFCHSA